MSADHVAAGRSYPFELDRFQREAIASLDAGRHVVVAAPTGSGKTVVAEHGVDLALARDRRAYYTAPIKALSNQKYRDLVELHGEGRVGLLTGDNSIDADAPVVVMTTEVLRNMIYGRRRSLVDLDVVVLDEVHFLQDAYRGPVWEEVIVHLPRHVRLVCLSATVSNAAELAEWITTVRGPTDVIVEERRPVELEHQYLVTDLTDGGDRARTLMLPIFTDGKPNRRAQRLDASAVRRPTGRDGRDGRDGRHAERARDRDPSRRRLATPGRVDSTRLLEQRSMLPAIHFIFSRNQCDAAARSCLDAGLRLTTDHERARIREIAHDRLDGLHPDDLAVLGHRRFLDQLAAGIAAHHAGMVPPFKEVVEACFVEGLVKIVFATETLAVGINMPARTVVIEKLTKFTGDRHEQLTPGQFTQLTGRAGRRGIDARGHAVVCWSPFVRFDQVAELAASRSFHLRSVFRPTYNMAANLVRNYGDEGAHRLLSLSFAQFQADRDVVRLEARLERRRERLAELRSAARSPHGDIDDYRRRADDDATSSPTTPNELIDAAIAELRPGAVIRARTGRYEGPVAVVANASRSTGHRLTVITPSGHHHQLRAPDLGALPAVIGAIDLPVQYAPGRKEFRRDVGRRLRAAGYTGRDDQRDDQRDERAAGRTLTHPVEADPDLRDRLRAAARADRVQREIHDLERRAERGDQTLAREFDAVLGVLGSRGYVHRDEWTLTASGEVLARIFHECDLLVAECLLDGLLDGLDAAELAGVVSTFVHEHRSPDDPPPPWFPSTELADRCHRIIEVSRRLAADEADAGLAIHRPPDPTFFAVAYAWVAGEGFAEVVDANDPTGTELTGGDFVRTVRQLIDLLGQVARVAPDRTTRRTAADAARRAFREVVADSASVGVGVGVMDPGDGDPQG